MSNSLSTMPIVLDTDLPSFNAAQTLRPDGKMSLRITKMALAVNGTSVAGVVTVTDPASGRELFAPMVIAAGATDKVLLFIDEFDPSLLVTNFDVTGLTATSTVLHIWYRS